MVHTFRLTRYLLITSPVSSQLMFQGIGCGICVEKLFSLEPQYQQYSKAYQQRKSNTASGKGMFVLEDSTRRHEHLDH
nr:protein ROS1A isoform X3 [Ipomoea batatas]